MSGMEEEELGEVARLAEEDVDEVIDLDEPSEPGGVNDVADNLDEMDLELEGARAIDDLADDAELVYSQHTDSVFCVRVDPMTCGRVVTGGQDDRALVWDVNTGNTIFECTGHQDSVTCVGFSHDGGYLATADMSGLIKVWKTSSWEEIWSFECSDVEWLEWHSGTNVLLVGTADGEVWMWKIPDGECKTLQGNGQSSNCGRILPDGTRACAGYADGAVKVWDLKTAGCLFTVAGHDAHKADVVTMDCHHDNTLVITGSAEVKAKIMNTITGKILTTFQCAKSGESEMDTEDCVESVGFSRSQPLAATGTLSGSLCVWDVPTQVLRQTCPHQGGIVKLKWDSGSPLIYTACLDGILRLWDARNGKAVSQWHGHHGELLDFDLSRDGNIVVSTSEDKTARLFSLHTPDR